MATDEARNEVSKARLDAAWMARYYKELADAASDAKSATLLHTISAGCNEIEIELDGLWKDCENDSKSDGEILARLIELMRDGLRKTTKSVGSAQHTGEEKL